MTVNLSSSSGTGVFAASSGSTQAITSMTIPANQSSISFYYGDTTAGSPTITVSSTNLQPASQTETIIVGAAERSQSPRPRPRPVLGYDQYQARLPAH